MTTRTRIALLTTSLVALGAGSQQAPAPAVDDALRNDLALAATVRAPAPQPYVARTSSEVPRYPAQGTAPARIRVPRPRRRSVRRRRGRTASPAAAASVRGPAPAPLRERVISHKRDRRSAP